MKGNRVDHIDQDAAEFGVHIKAGGWRLGLLVARNVQPGTGEGRPPRNRETLTVVKVSAAEFARLAGTSVPRTLRYFDAWERAADVGLVPHAATLAPGDDVEWDEEFNTVNPWTNFYSSGKTTVDTIRQNKPAMRQAIAENPEFAEAAAEALAETAPAATKRETFKRLAADPDVGGHDRTRFEAETTMRDAATTNVARRREVVEQSTNKVAQSLGYTDALLTMDHIASNGRKVADLWTRGSDSWSDDQRAEFRARWSETRHELDTASQAFASDFDAELADLLGGAE